MRLPLVLSGLTAVSILLASEAVAPLGTYRPVERRHWAFRARVRPQVPAFTDPADRAWVQNPVDAFILTRLEKEHLHPAPRADRQTLIRRVYFDLTGLPPTPAEIDAFVSDRSRDAYPRLIERLLASPRYGEKWGQHWLDVVRFGESDGFEYDTHRPDAWRYRDYVIRSFNNDKPFDRFVTEQLAGDEISPEEDETEIAAGFNRLAPLRKNAGNQEVASSRNEVLTEMTNIVGQAFLGVTLHCARCHDHKFDPIRQSDYYRMEAYFAAAEPLDRSKATAAEQAEWKAKAEPIQAQMKQMKAKMKGSTAEQRAELERKIEDLQDELPAPLPALFTVADDPAKRTDMHVLVRGNYAAKGDRVGMRPLGVLLPDAAPEMPVDTPKPRLQLARWITSPENPLTSRVMVNRIWEYHFGRGIVGTPNDFGRMGERPTHPELLDYLASEFVESGYSIKHIQRLILLSSTFQQASTVADDKAAKEKDPEDKLLWRFNRRRLEAEEIRDAMLASAGNLNLKSGGPSVLVPIDKELVEALYKPSQWAVTRDESEHNRRSVYLMAKRNLRLPFMEVFDAPDTQVSCPRRESSTHPPQALELLNGRLANVEADVLAARLLTEIPGDRARQVERAYRLVTGRAPNAREKQLAVEFLKAQPLREFTLATFNLNAFLYVN